MQWIAPASKDTSTATLEKRLWDAADELRANSGLKAGQYSSRDLPPDMLPESDTTLETG